MSLAAQAKAAPKKAAPAKAAQASAAQAKFEIDKVSHDFGDVFAGEEVVHVFRIVNKGMAPLELSDAPPVKTASAAVFSSGSFFRPLLPVALRTLAASPT